MTVIPSAIVRQNWGETTRQALREPIEITERGHDFLTLIDTDLARRALRALEDAEDGHEAAKIRSRIASGEEQTYCAAEVASELGLTLG